MKKIIFLIALTSLLLATACGGNRNGSDPQYHKESRAASKTIAKVGESEIKLFLLDEYTKMYQTNFNAADEEYNAKKEYLDSLINMYVFVEAAYTQGLEKDPEILKVMQESEPALMRDELFKLKILPFLNVTDEEIQRWYDHMDREVRMSGIFISDSVRADSVYSAINKGADFGAAARKFSEEQSTAVKSGDLDYQIYPRLSEEFQNKVFDLDSGKLVLFKSGGMWNIAKVTGSRPIQRESLEMIRDLLISNIQAVKKAQVQGKFYEELFNEIDIRINEETAEFIYDKAATLYPDVMGGVPFRKNTFNPEDLADFERKMILASYKGGEITLGDYLLQTARWTEQQRPPFKETEALRRAVFNLRLKEILQSKAEELKLAETVDYKDALRFYKDQIMAAKMKDLIIEEKSFVTEEEVVQYYREHSGDYTIPKKLHLLEIMVGSEALADEIYSQLQKGADFQELAEKYTTRPVASGSKGDLGYIADFNYPTLFAEGEKLKRNEFSKPFPVGDGWSIVKLLDTKDQQVKLFDEVAKQIKSDLQNAKSEKAIEQWLTENRDKHKANVNYDMIWETIDKSAYE